MMLGKPQRALCIILGLCTAAFFIIQVWGKDASENHNPQNESFTVTQRFYGVDAAEMERIAAIPLEDALSGIRGLRRIFSSSENGRARVVCYFEGREQGRYEAVREAAQRVYESLPSAAQRPEIASSGDSRIPVWTAAFYGDKTGPVLEKALKPALEGLPGAGNVEVSGAGLREIVITLKDKEAAARKIDAADIAAALANNDVLLPGGSIRRNGEGPLMDQEIPVMVDGRYGMSGPALTEAEQGQAIEELRHALIPVQNSGGGRSYVHLEDVADIAEQERNYENRSRLDGQETALIAVMGSDGADLGKLSLRIKEELAKFPGLEFTILSDRGEAERQARSSALGAAFQGACMVALLCALISFGKRNFSLICSLTVPLALFFSAALLILFGFSPDKLVLAGLSAGVGAAVDASILCAEYFRSCKTIGEGKTTMVALRFPLVSGSLTTVIALLPLMAQKSSGMNSVAWSVASVNVVAMLLALTLLPPLFLWGCPVEMPAARAAAAQLTADLKRDRNKPKSRVLKCDRDNPRPQPMEDLKCDRNKSKSLVLIYDHINPETRLAVELKCDRTKPRMQPDVADLKCDRIKSRMQPAADLKCDHINPKLQDLKCDRFNSTAKSAVNSAISTVAIIVSPLARFYRRRLAVLMRLLIGRPLPVIGFWLLLSVLGITALCLNGADVEQESSEDSVYAQVEFDGGLHMEETDKLLAGYGVDLKNYPGIRNVQTVARTGTGSALVSFDPRLTDDKAVRRLMRNTPVPGGFLYIVESSGNERNWRLRIAGDEEGRCRELAAEAARRCAALPEITETVLNFKEGSPRINLRADRERIALNGLSFGGIGQTIRRGIHGPVAYKRIDGSGETDVRIRGMENPMSREEVLEILVKGETSPIGLGSIVTAENSREAASIQREDRRRSASISIRTKVMDPRRVRDRIMTSLSGLQLPPGYTVEFDPEALKAAEGVSAQAFLFVLALLFCYMVIAALKESFTFPLALLAVVPPSLAVPALCMVLRDYPLNAVSAAAFVAVSGLAVNAAALVADALEGAAPDARSCYGVFRRRLPVLAATTLTTVAGAVPFLFIKSNAALVVKTLSLVSALGVAVSALCAVTLIPALVKLFPGVLKRQTNGNL